MKYSVNGARIVATENETLVAGARGAHIAEFTFDAAWDGYVTKKAVFKRENMAVEQLIVDGVCVIPWEALCESGTLLVGVYGESDDKRRPTLWASPKTVNSGAHEGDISQEPTPDTWQQLLTAIGDVAPHIGDDGHWYVGGVDTGVSAQGETGASGKDGTDGYTPVRGTDYWTQADKAEIKAYVDEAILGGAW